MIRKRVKRANSRGVARALQKCKMKSFARIVKLSISNVCSVVAGLLHSCMYLLTRVVKTFIFLEFELLTSKHRSDLGI